MGPPFGDVTTSRRSSDTQSRSTSREPSPFLLEALEATIQKPGAVLAPGRYCPSDQTSPNELRANPTYYLGRPAIDRIVVSAYPSVRCGMG